MNDAETILILLTCVVGITCITAVQIKRGIIMGSTTSLLRQSSKKYVERKGKRKSFYTYLGIAFITILLVGLPSIKDLKSMVVFVVSNLSCIAYFLSYFVLLESKDKSE